MNSRDAGVGWTPLYGLATAWVERFLHPTLRWVFPGFRVHAIHWYQQPKSSSKIIEHVCRNTQCNSARAQIIALCRQWTGWKSTGSRRCVCLRLCPQSIVAFVTRGLEVIRRGGGFCSDRGGVCVASGISIKRKFLGRGYFQRGLYGGAESRGCPRAEGHESRCKA